MNMDLFGIIMISVAFTIYGLYATCCVYNVCTCCYNKIKDCCKSDLPLDHNLHETEIRLPLSLNLHETELNSI